MEPAEPGHVTRRLNAPIGVEPVTAVVPVAMASAAFVRELRNIMNSLHRINSSFSDLWLYRGREQHLL
jgi:hypothetical protein